MASRRAGNTNIYTTPKRAPVISSYLATTGGGERGGRQSVMPSEETADFATLTAAGTSGAMVSFKVAPLTAGGPSAMVLPLTAGGTSGMVSLETGVLTRHKALLEPELSTTHGRFLLLPTNSTGLASSPLGRFRTKRLPSVRPSGPAHIMRRVEILAK
eukprot:GHVS01036299.1.p1 GENE.GHVS01036299.1~~GHVS01036299.1.p1  ORF type:complete len:158 (+),score=26.12 GHVS01036299.1:202-675(+)